MKLHHCLACCLLAWSSPAALGEDITVSWRDKPPYHYMDGDSGYSPWPGCRRVS